MRVVTTTPERPVLEQFAAAFHQDLKLMGVNPLQWGIELARSYTPAQRGELRAALVRSLETNAGASANGLVNSWRRLGAVSWPTSSDLRITIQAWIEGLK